MSVKKYKRGAAVQLTANFNTEEFDCKGISCRCISTRIDTVLVRKLQVLRKRAGNAAITINSGNRCEKHNKSVGGGSSSYHLNTKGQAADIVIRGMSPEQAARLAQEVGFRGIGCYNGTQGRFIHVDTRSSAYFWKNTTGVDRGVSGHGGKKLECPYPLGSATLRRGSAGTSVRGLQWILGWAGYPCGDDGGIDGIFGLKTRAAVIAFQRDMMLEDDGIVGPETLAALREVAS